MLGGLGVCARCGDALPLAELLAYWPVRDPSAIRYVCRPRGERYCFRFAVGGRWQHEIAAIEVAA